jgi:hypothetical protein
MIRWATRSISRWLLPVWFACLVAGSAQAEDPPSAGTEADPLQQRIDFGNAQILGQQIKSGAVYLMHRKKSDIKTMLEVRRHYREEIKADFDPGNTALTRRTAKDDDESGSIEP